MHAHYEGDDSGFWILDSGFWILDSGFWFLVSGFWCRLRGFEILYSVALRLLGSVRGIAVCDLRISDFGFRMSFTCVSAPARSVDRPGRKMIAPVYSPWHDPSIVQATRCGRAQQPYSKGSDDW